MKLHEVRSLSDLAISKVLQIYEESFPVDERMKLTTWADMFKEWYHDANAQGSFPYRRRILFAIQNDDCRTIGMAYCQIVDVTHGQRAGYLGYFAIAQEERGGTGTEAYRVLMDWFIGSKGCDAVIFQIEKDEAGEVAVRRRNWYKRMGAKQLSGVEHYLRLPGQASVPLHVMVQYHQPISAETVMMMGQVVLIQSSYAPGQDRELPIRVIGQLGLI